MNNAWQLVRRRPGLSVLGLCWLVLFWAGFNFYPGSSAIYLLFSVLFLALPVSGFYKRYSYGYLFLAMFVWLGFWFKLTANYLLFGSFPFGEPVGQFDSSPAAWDATLWIAICAASGLLIARLLHGLTRHRFRIRPAIPEAPPWYETVRPWLWAVAVVLAVGVPVLNVSYGIHQVGMTPRTILHWPLNALIAWMLNLGSALTIAVLVWWDCARPRTIGLPFSAMLGEAFLSTVSVLSRSGFPFHAFPQMLALNDTRSVSQRCVGRLRLVALGLFVVLCLAAITAVSFVRDHQYVASKSLPTPDPIAAPTPPLPRPAASAPTQPVSSFRLILAHQLLVNRWIGLEGVMAVSAFPGKGAPLFWSMLSEKREPGKVTAYQGISNSGYQNADPNFQFATLPGATAFFSYSGSLLVVLGGMALMALLLLIGEDLVMLLTRNPLLCALFGMTTANTIAQFGVTPRQDIPFFAMIFASMLLIAGLQSNGLTKTVARLRSRNAKVPSSWKV